MTKMKFMILFFPFVLTIASTQNVTVNVTTSTPPVTITTGQPSTTSAQSTTTTAHQSSTTTAQPFTTTTQSSTTTVQSSTTTAKPSTTTTIAKPSTTTTTAKPSTTTTKLSTTTTKPSTTTASEPLVLNAVVHPDDLASLIESIDSDFIHSASAPAGVVSVDEGETYKRSPSSYYGGDGYASGYSGGSSYKGSGHRSPYACGGCRYNGGRATYGSGSGGGYPSPPAHGSSYGHAEPPRGMDYGVGYNMGQPGYNMGQPGYNMGQPASSGVDLGSVIKVVGSGLKNVLNMFSSSGSANSYDNGKSYGYGGQGGYGQGYVSYEKPKGFDLKALGLGVGLGAVKGVLIGTKIGIVKGVILNRLKQALMNKKAAMHSYQYSSYDKGPGSYGSSGAYEGGYGRSGKGYGSVYNSYDNNYRSDVGIYNGASSQLKGDLPLTYTSGQHADGSYDGSYFVKPSSTGFGHLKKGAAWRAAKRAMKVGGNGMLNGGTNSEGKQVYGVTKKPLLDDHKGNLSGQVISKKLKTSPVFSPFYGVTNNVTITKRVIETNKARNPREAGNNQRRNDKVPILESLGNGLKALNAKLGCKVNRRMPCPDGDGGYGHYSKDEIASVLYKVSKPKLKKGGKGFYLGALGASIWAIPVGIFNGWYLMKNIKEFERNNHLTDLFDPPPAYIEPPRAKQVGAYVVQHQIPYTNNY